MPRQRQSVPQHGSLALLSPRRSPRFETHRTLGRLTEQPPQRLAGACLLIASVDVLMGIVTAQALFRGNYSTTGNTLSDLGANPLNGEIPRASAIVFDVSMISTGLLIIASSYLLYRLHQSVLVSVAMFFFGAGVLGVGIFPENLPTLHSSFAGISFLGGAVAAIASYRLVRSPFRYVAVLLGAIALITLVLWVFGASQPVGFLGSGGIERWVVYPVTIWLAGFAGYLLAEPTRER